ncbi:MAG TPA: YpdA family putative bacillithiol disulfide reductase [Terriglobia bacterium]|jgi:thioredoxin reductase (NADPH)
MTESFDVVVIGAGPTGLACAIEAQKAGFRAINVDKGCLVNSLYNYPANMIFFTTPELLEIGDIPFTTAHQKPTRSEALEYYRKVSEHYRLEVRQYENVERITGADGRFVIQTVDRTSSARQYAARKIVIATGFYDLPNMMGIPGEDLPKVHHYYGEPHPYFDADVAVIGAKNSAAIAALELWRHGARVTLVHRGPVIHQNVKYWIKPDIENRIKNGEVTAHFNTIVREITPTTIVLDTPEGELTLKNDFVLALTGYHPDLDFLRQTGIEIGPPPDCRPSVNAETLETNIPGIYLGGVVVAGNRTAEIFIENGRFHGREIAADLKRKLGGADGSVEVSRERKSRQTLQSAE